MLLNDQSNDNFLDYPGKFAITADFSMNALAQHVPDKTVNSIDKIVTMKSSWSNPALSE
jgi:hypothetical protein